MQDNTIHYSQVTGSELVLVVVRVVEQGVDLVLNSCPEQLQCNARQYSTMQYNAGQYNTL